MTRSTRTRRPKRLGGAAPITLTVVLLGACGGPGSIVAASGDEPTKSPLENALGDVTSSGIGEAETNALQMQVEEATAACMAAQGFEYTPIDYSQMGSGPEEPPASHTTDRAYAEEYGYGISMMREPQEVDAAEWVDPNQDYVNAMSEAEQQAYNDALFGKTEADSGEPVDMSQMGCSGQANAAVHDGHSDVVESEVVSSFQEDMEQLHLDYESDAEVAGLNAAWVACMTDAGFGDYSKPQDARDDFTYRLNEYLNSGAADPGSAAAAGTPERSQVELQKAERETAIADFACREELDYDSTTTRLRFAIEKEYVDTHRSEIEAIKAAYEKIGS